MVKSNLIFSLACLTFTLLNGIASAVIDPNLILWYQCEEMSVNGTVYDSTPNQNNASKMRDVTIDANGVIGKCLRFKDGGGALEAYIRVVDSTYTFANLSSEITVAFWWNGDNTTGTDLMRNTAFSAVDYSAIQQIGITIPYMNSGYLYFNTINAAERVYMTPDPVTYRNNWRHWSFTKKTGIGGEMKIYLDGRYIAGSLSDTFTPFNGSTFYDVRLGRQFNGRMDDIRVYSKCLNSEQIKSVYLEAFECDPMHPLIADLDGNCTVNFGDLSIMAGQWLANNAQ